MQRTCQASRAVLRVCELLLRDKGSRNGLRYGLDFLLTRLIASVPPFHQIASHGMITLAQ